MKFIWSIRKRLLLLQPRPRLWRHEGCLFLLDPTERLDRNIMAGKPFEKKQLAFARAQVEEIRPTRFIDIGANFGLYTAIFGSRPFIERVDAFEPVQRTYNHLTANVYVNRLDAKVRLHRVGLGNETAETEIRIVPGFSALSRISLDKAEKPADFSEKEVITIARGDDRIQGDGETIYIKIDVEGFVQEVLSGLEVFLKSNFGLLQVEIPAQDMDIPRYLEALGWKKVLTLTGDSFFRKTSTD